MKHWIGKRIISILLVLVMILPYAVIATGTTTTEDLKNAQDKQSSYDQKIKDLTNELVQITKNVTDIEAYIKTIDKKMTDINDMINNLNAQIDEKNAQIAENEALLAQAKIDSAQQYESMKLRIQYMYEHQSESYVEIMLASKDMGDLLNKAEYINKITDYDREMLTKLAETEKLIQNTQVTLQNEQTELEESKDSVEQQKSSLQLVQDSKDVELKKLNDKAAQANSDKSQYQKEQKEQQTAIDKILADIKSQNDAANSSGGSSSTTNSTVKYNGGKFTWPVPASGRITSYFGEMEDRTTSHNGIDIGASTPHVDGDQIVAAYDGQVVTATYSSSAGNWIWINHGGGLLTVYMHTSKILVSVGQMVKKGEVIALMGNTGNSTGTHLHFGILVNGGYVNPLTSGYLSK